MGSFSWNRADEPKVGEAENIYYGMDFKCLIPKEFGGGFIRDKYRDYGDMIDSISGKRYDLYELLAFWNSEKVVPRAVEFKCIYKKFEVGERVTIAERDGMSDVVKKLIGGSFTISDVFVGSAVSNCEKRLFALKEVPGILFDRLDFEQETKYIYEPVAGLLYDALEMPKLPERNSHTGHNRSLGIDLCYPNRMAHMNYTRVDADACVDKLRFPLKLVAATYEGTYEDCVGRSYSDPDQGTKRIHHG